MAIVRTARPERNFYILDKRISEDKRLSWGARGLLVFLLGKPDHWKVSIQVLVNETERAAKRSGKSVIYGYLDELLEVGYVTRQKYSSGEIDYFVHEMPRPTEPNSKNPDLDKPDLENPTQVSTDSKQGLTQSEDLLGTGGVADATPAGDGKKKAAQKEPAPTTAVWDAYVTAYKKRYGIEPLPRDFQTNAQLAKLVGRVGADKAVEVVGHYLSMDTAFYKQAQHPVGILLKDVQLVWNSMHNASAAGRNGKPKTMADYDAIDYSKGVRADGSF
ncbi:hypothetical protein KDW82_06870 [Burkholderia vietnamiensis]|uniref:hypothetical protein n=1 Tax=Burkholderia vietnamiensis TaxID=60552 RepID=UPI001B8F7656|nr:hypothetical protein [Burkholderia vietnamiensis]MBR8188781.1 hypothetical protein [Burkholderia vietnamiensis]